VASEAALIVVSHSAGFERFFPPQRSGAGKPCAASGLPLITGTNSRPELLRLIKTSQKGHENHKEVSKRLVITASTSIYCNFCLLSQPLNCLGKA